MTRQQGGKAVNGSSVDADGSSRPVSHDRRSWAPLLPVALLVSAIAFHGFLIVAREDDPQRSGAFAMFATIDVGATRKVVATTKDGTVTLDIPASLDQPHAALLDTPSESSAKRLASLLRGLTWDVSDGTATEGGAVALDDVRLQVVGLDADGRTIVRQVLVDVEVGPQP